MTGLVFYATLAVYACLITSIYHRLDLFLERDPVREEDTRNTRHRQDERITLQHFCFVLIVSQRIAITKELIAETVIILTQERIVVINECYSITALSCTQQTASFQCTVVAISNSIVECRELRCKVKGSRGTSCFIQMVLQIAHAAVPHLHYRKVRIGYGVVIRDITVLETLTIVVTETVHMYIVDQPFKVCFAHELYVLALVIPITTAFEIIQAVITRIVVTGCFSEAVTRILFGFLRPVQIIRAADPSCCRLINTILTEVLLSECTPTRFALTMVDYDIFYDTRSQTMQFLNQFIQVRFGSPSALQTTILDRQITCASGRTGERG